MNIFSVEVFNQKNIGLSISGGADSALLAYYLMKTVTRPLHFFTYGSEEKQNRTVRNSLSVIEKCISITGNSNVYHHIRYGKTQDRKIFFDYLIESVDSKIVDIIYTGTTSTPQHDVLETFSKKLSSAIKHRRNPNVIKPLWSHSNKLYHPFINIDKKNIAKMYNDLDLLDSLYPVTGSCESVDFPTGHCGNCWWCQERFWAFERL
jgi:7-cyano-7-deazaguanine synthase in queuosine biosynthesis